MKNQTISAGSVVLSVRSRLLSVHLPCGCRVSGGHQIHHCGCVCDWFHWSENEVYRAGKLAIYTLLARSGFSDVLNVRPSEVLEFLDPEDQCDGIEIPATDFKMTLQCGDILLGALRPVAA